MKKVLNIILTIILIIILLFVSYLKFVKKEKNIEVFGYRFLIVLTGSMKPEIKPNSLIIIKEENNYKIGDIVTYLDNGFFTTHRIIEKDKNFVVTKGDNNFENDGKISNNKILGKVIFKSYKLGVFIREYLKYIFIFFSLVIIFINIFWNFKERKKDEEIKNKSS